MGSMARYLSVFKLTSLIALRGTRLHHFRVPGVSSREDGQWQDERQSNILGMKVVFMLAFRLESC